MTDDLKLWILQFYFLAVWRLSEVSADIPDNYGEFCNQQTFSKTCPEGHVIEITQARFGRMRIGDCTSNNMNISCDVNALPVLARQCSGVRACSIDVSDVDKLLANQTRLVCSTDYRLHLYVHFRCLPIETEPNEMCATSGPPEPITVSRSEGYLASITTRDTNKGSHRCPWHIRGLPGQTIQISLLNYNEQVDPSMCYIYAYIRERALPNSETKLMDCGLGNTQGRVFTSLSESLDIVIMDPSHNRNFVLHYRALGCPDVKTTEGTEVVRRGNTTTILCNDKNWTLHCKAGDWEGERGDCAKQTGNQSGDFPWPASWSQEFTIVLIIGLAILIAVVIVVIGVCLVKRKTGQSFEQSSQHVGEYGVYGLRGPVVPSKCYYPTLPLPPGSVCQGSGSESSHYTTTIQRRQAVPPGSVTPSVDGFSTNSHHLLQQADLTSCASCPVHSYSYRNNNGTYHDRVGVSGWQTFPIRRPDHIYESPKFGRKQAHDLPFYHELDPQEVQKQLREQRKQRQKLPDIPGQQVVPKSDPDPDPKLDPSQPAQHPIQQTPHLPDSSSVVTDIPTEDEILDDEEEDPLPPPPPPLPPDNDQ